MKSFAKSTLLLTCLLASMARGEQPKHPLDAAPEHLDPGEAPRIECDSTMIRRARARIESKQEPFYSYWQGVQAETDSARKLSASPYRGPDPLKFHHAAQTDGIAARLLAYSWLLEDDDEAAVKAIELLHHWASRSPLPGTAFDPKIRFPNAGMDVSRLDVGKSQPLLPDDETGPSGGRPRQDLRRVAIMDGHAKRQKFGHASSSSRTSTGSIA